MIDGIKLIARIKDFDAWKNMTRISFPNLTDLDTGEVIGRKLKCNQNIITYNHYGKFETYNLIVKETDFYENGRFLKKTFILFVKGSLHKNFYQGVNYERLNWYDLQSEIDKLTGNLCLQPEQLKIQNVEVGLNVITPFPVTDYINGSVLFHSTKPFENYDPDGTGLILGRLATHTQHSVKCYDKGVQNSLNYELMRFEDRCIKMQYIAKYGIKTLKDLTDYTKVSKLVELILSAWDNVLVYEPDIDLDKGGLSIQQKELLEIGQYRDFWVKLHKEDSRKFHRQRTMLRKLMATNSPVNTQSLIRDLIKEEWAVLIGR
jgi:hypothetical protein